MSDSLKSIPYPGGKHPGTIISRPPVQFQLLGAVEVHVLKQVFYNPLHSLVPMVPSVILDQYLSADPPGIKWVLLSSSLSVNSPHFRPLLVGLPLEKQLSGCKKYPSFLQRLLPGSSLSIASILHPSGCNVLIGILSCLWDAFSSMVIFSHQVLI